MSGINSPDPSSHGPWAALPPLFRWLGLSTVLFWLPFLLVAGGWERRWADQAAEQQARQFRRLDAILLRLMATPAATLYLPQVFLATRKAARADRWLSAGLRWKAHLQLRFPGLLRFTVTDRRGEIVPGLTDGRPDPVGVRDLARFQRRLATPAEKSPGPPGEVTPAALAFMGPCASPDQVRAIIGDLREVGLYSQDRFLFLLVDRNQTVFIHVSHTPTWDLLPVQDRCGRVNGSLQSGGVTIGLYDPVLALAQPPLPEWLFHSLELQDRQHLALEQGLAAILTISPTARLWAVQEGREASDLLGVRSLFWLGGLAMGLYVLLVVWRWETRPGALALPIRWQVLTLFSAAALLPLLVFWVAGGDYLREVDRVRVREAQGQVERALRVMEEQYRQWRFSLQTHFQRTMSGRRFVGSSERKSVCLDLFRFARRFRATEAMIVASQGQVLATLGGDFKVLERPGARFFRQLIRGVLAKLNHENATGLIDATGLFLESVSGLEDPIRMMATSLGQMFQLFRREKQSWSMSVPLRGGDGRPQYLVCVQWPRGGLEAHFIEWFFRWSRKVFPGMVFAVSPPDDPVTFCSHPVRPIRLSRFRQEMKRRQTVVVGSFSHGSRRSLAAGFRSNELTGYFLVGAMGDGEIRRDLRFQEFRLTVLGLLCLAICGFLGSVLTERILTPVGQLAEGVDWIRRRRFDGRVPVSGQDELGRLALTFNQALEGMRDLEVGRIVQESLFPRRGLQLGTPGGGVCTPREPPAGAKEGAPRPEDLWKVWARTRSASALSGDYFDLRLLSDGRLLVLVGDVTGHGVPAALVMAMAKALVEREIQHGSGVVAILDTMHRILLRIMARRRMMTCLVGILDPRTAVFSYANAGHNFPVLFPRRSPPETLAGGSMPLGSWRRNTFSTLERKLDPGDILLLYTDGLIEATDRQGSAIGSAAMIAAVERLRTSDPREMCERIFAWQREITGSEEQEDDVTVLVLSRA